MPKVSEGAVHLEEWDFVAHGPVVLRGQWEFYPSVFLDPTEARTLDKAQRNFINAPALWNTFGTQNGAMGAYGYGTYRLVAHIKDTSLKYGLKIPDFATSYKAFVNGQEIASNGFPGTSRAQTRPEWRPLAATFRTGSPEMEILVHVANFSHIKGGMWEPISIGTAEGILRQRDLAVALSVFVFGSLFVMGLHHLAIFAMQRDDLPSLFLGLFCAVISLRALITGEVFLATLIPNLDFELLAKLEYGSGCLAMAAFLAFMVALFPRDFPRPLLIFVYVSTLCAVLVIGATHLKDYALLLRPFQIILAAVFIYGFIVVVKRAYQRQADACWLLAGSFVLMGTVLNDIAYANRIHGASGLSNTVPFGLLAFVLSQSLVIAQRFSLALRTSENLAAELESKVYQRTQELEEANMHLQLAATKDVLTRLNNRYNLYRTIEQENLAYEKRDADSIVYSLIYLDLDHFKQFNDGFGHDIGDFILQQFADVLLEAVGEEENVYRVGGDEFIILLPGHSREAAWNLAMTIVEMLKKRRFPLDILEQALGLSIAGHRQITCSIGIASYIPGTTFDLHKMLTAADKDMLAAKDSQKHQIMEYER